jgi:hypothetical protein
MALEVAGSGDLVSQCSQMTRSLSNIPRHAARCGISTGGHGYAGFGNSTCSSRQAFSSSNLSRHALNSCRKARCVHASATPARHSGPPDLARNFYLTRVNKRSHVPRRVVLQRWFLLPQNSTMCSRLQIVAAEHTVMKR